LSSRGFVLIIIEIFVIPGFGFVGITGLLCLALGFYMALTRVPFPKYAWDFSRLEDAGQTVTTATVLFAMLTLVTWRYLPRTALWRSLINSTEQDVHAGYTVQSPEVAVAAVGLRGIATSTLRPAGRARFGDRTLDVMTRGEFIVDGTPVEIIAVDGNRTLVSAVTGEHQA
jgi:membrane-bound serine protease (ClpP class)